MTQHRWSTTDGWDVLAGWDRVQPQHYFIQVSRECITCGGDGFSTIEDNEECRICEGRGEEFLYDNLSDTAGLTDRMGHMTLIQLQLALRFLLTEWPTEFLTAVQEDRNRQAEPYVRRYDNVGKAITIRPLSRSSS